MAAEQVLSGIEVKACENEKDKKKKKEEEDENENKKEHDGVGELDAGGKKEQNRGRVKRLLRLEVLAEKIIKESR